MKALPWLFALAPLLLAPCADAQIDLAWNNCLGVGTHGANKNYVCDGSLEGQSLKAVASFIAPPGITAFRAVQAVVSIHSVFDVPPDWWRLGSGECRSGSLVFPGSLSGVGNVTCKNPWLGAGWTAGSYEFLSEALWITTHAQLVMVQHRDTSVPLTAGSHYIACAFDLIVNRDDQGGDFCAGCDAPACLILQRITLYQEPGALPAAVPLELAATRQYITWQGGAIGWPCQPMGGWPPYPTDSRRSTWGSIKTTYR